MGHVLNIYQPKWSHTFSPQQQCLLWILIRAGTSKCHGSNMSAVDTIVITTVLSVPVGGRAWLGVHCRGGVMVMTHRRGITWPPVTCTCSHPHYSSAFPTQWYYMIIIMLQGVTVEVFYCHIFADTQIVRLSQCSHSWFWVCSTTPPWPAPLSGKKSTWKLTLIIQNASNISFRCLPHNR